MDASIRARIGRGALSGLAAICLLCSTTPAAEPTPDELLAKVLQSLRAQEHRNALKGLLAYVAEGKRQGRDNEFRLVAKEVLTGDLGRTTASCRLSIQCFRCKGKGGGSCRRCKGDGNVQRRSKKVLRWIVKARMSVTTVKWYVPQRCDSCEGGAWRPCKSCDGTGLSLIAPTGDDRQNYPILDIERPHLVEALAKQADVALAQVSIAPSLGQGYAATYPAGTETGSINPGMVDKEDMRWVLAGRSLLDKAAGMALSAEDKMRPQTRAQGAAAQYAQTASILDDRFSKEGEENRIAAFKDKGIGLDASSTAE